MDRRGFLKGGALAAVTAALKPAASGARDHQRDFSLQNAQLAWHLRSTADGIRSISFENRISGRRFALQAENEFRLTFSSGQRIEIPWWDFRLGDETPVSPERESGLIKGFHRGATDTTSWPPVYNLSGGQHGRTYSGYAWFGCKAELPESAKGKEIVLVLGGYDEQDWNDYWIYLNGQQVGRRTSSGRWRKAGRFTLRPSDSLYASLQFGSSNLLAVRTRAYIAQGYAQREGNQLIPCTSHVHARCASPGRLQAPLKANVIDFTDLVKRLAAGNYPGGYAIEYVWVDWEHCNEVDNVGETILLRGVLEAAARSAA